MGSYSGPTTNAANGDPEKRGATLARYSGEREAQNGQLM
jgi:hypothetical protein